MCLRDAGVALTFHELAQRAKVLLVVRLQQIPDPTGDRFEDGDPLRRQPPSIELTTAPANPGPEPDLDTLKQLDMKRRDAGMAFAFHELSEGAIQPPPEGRRGLFNDGQLELIEVLDAEDPQMCRFEKLLVGDWSEGGEAAEPVEFGFEAEVVGLQGT